MRTLIRHQPSSCEILEMTVLYMLSSNSEAACCLDSGAHARTLFHVCILSWFN